jgi:hypothetical protein
MGDLRRRLLREAPLLVGILVGALFLWWLGGAGVLDGGVEGYRWPDFLHAAWAVEAGRPELIGSFRTPIYGWLVSLVTGPLTLPNAALVIAMISGWALLLGAALLGRGLAGPWAGGVSAACAPWVATVADASRWATPYPLLAAGTGLGLGLAALSWRGRPGLAAGLGLLAGLASGLAWGFDERGLAFAPACVLLLLIGLRREPRWWLRLLALPLFALGLSTGPALNAAVAPDRSMMPVEERQARQRSVAQRWIDHSGDARLQQACAAHGDLLLQPGILETPCASATLAHNLGRQLPGQLPFGLGLTLLTLPLVLLPDRRGWRGTVAAAGGLGLALAAMAALGTLTVLPERYLIQLAVPLGVLAPVGLAKGCRLAPERIGRWLVPLALLGVALLVWVLDLGDRHRSSELRRNGHYAAWLEAGELARARLRPGDLFQDCSQHYVDLQLQPSDHLDAERGFMSGAPGLDPDTSALCRLWIRQPPLGPGSSWLGVRDDEVFGDLADAHAGWVLVDSSGQFQLWRWVAKQ